LFYVVATIPEIAFNLFEYFLPFLVSNLSCTQKTDKSLTK